MDGTRQAVFQPVDIIVHTKRDVEVERTHKVGFHLRRIGVVLPQKLCRGDHLESIVPALRGLQAQFTRIAEEVLGALGLVERVALGRLYAELHLQLIVPAQLLLVVVVGLKRQRADCRIVSFTTFIPVARDIALEKLQVVITAEGPEIGFEHHHVHRHILRLFRFGRLDNGRRVFDNRRGLEHRPRLLQVALRRLDRARPMEVDPQQ